MKKDFLSIAELTAEEIYGIFELTRDLKEKTRKRIEHHLLKRLFAGHDFRQTVGTNPNFL